MMEDANLYPVKGFSPNNAVSKSSAALLPYNEKYFLYFMARNIRPVDISGVYSADIATKVQKILDGNTWRFILTDYNENTSEGYDLRDTMSDTYTVMATGSNPTQVTLTGFLPLYKGTDLRLDFLFMYHVALRGSMAQKYGIYAFLSLGTGVANIINIQSFSVQQDANMQDMVPFTLTGVASG